MAGAVRDDGRAWKNFRPSARPKEHARSAATKQIYPVAAQAAGHVMAIDNRLLARAAKLAGAPDAKAAGIMMHVQVGDGVERGQPLFTLHAENSGELSYALEFVERKDGITKLRKDKAAPRSCHGRWGIRVLA